MSFVKKSVNVLATIGEKYADAYCSDANCYASITALENRCLGKLTSASSIYEIAQWIVLFRQEMYMKNNIIYGTGICAKFAAEEMTVNSQQLSA